MINYATSALIAIAFIGYSFAELFSSTEEFRGILDAQKQIAQELKTFLSVEEERLQKILKLAADFERESLQIGDDAFISNPINAYHVAKRFHQERLEVKSLFDNNQIVNASLATLEPHIKKLPSRQDFIESINALMRLQDTYRLSPSVLADALLPQVINTSRLSVADCYEIGRAAYNNSDFYHTAIWMQEAYDRLHLEKSRTSVDKVAILGYLAFAVYKQGNVERSLQLTKELLAIQPDHPYAASNIAKMEEELELRDSDKSTKRDIAKDTSEAKQNMEDYKKGELYQSYESLCRGEIIKPIKSAHKLTCDYARNNDPRLLIAPMKRETLHLDPWVFVYYDAIGDKEIQFLKEKAFAKLSRATVRSSADGSFMPSKIRITKVAWLNNQTDKVIVPGVLRRISAMTQLSLENGEDLQVANYGIGGHYEPHYDFALPNKNATLREDERGNRLVTSLFYLSDVTAGGATVFTSLGLQVKPIKGAVLMWYNLYKSGEVDTNLRHGACPVLVGNKWVMTKWLRIKGNEFWHQCSRDSTERFSLHDLEHATPSYHRARGRFAFNL